MRKIALLILGVFLTIHMYSQNNTIKIEKGESREVIINKASHVIPADNQLDALRNKFIAFIHFRSNTFTRMEWGSGMEDASVFDLKTLETDQWCGNEPGATRDTEWNEVTYEENPGTVAEFHDMTEMAHKYQNDLIIVDRTIRGKYENYQTPERSIPVIEWKGNRPVKGSNVISLLTNKRVK